ncbi:hypothetical protein AVU42_gp145 [Prochlorococcus phage P-TIM68]|uniref:Uncharacterized protein n=1 Tax=Prochlorococcus phage P-TIM68 TaxID=1542477 RepID=A0A0K0KVI7_9CAUD|nr:hypothetical protein AVU42_gp145 [Prochlorococcus phage P-TIM68]AIR93481.1 hypothetical protein [Prochlorococcus phage P-TIM68]
MTVKLALLKSGEEVISDIDEMTTDREIVVGYYFTNPCRAILTTPEIQVDDSLASDKKPVAIKLLPWFPLANEEKIPVVADWVISIVEPQPKLKDLYTKACENYEKRKSQSDSSTDKGNVSSTDRGSSE